MNENTRDFPAEAVTALENGSKIEAIKYVRMHQGLGLKEAKELVEHYIENNPDVKSRMQSANVQSVKISLRWLIVIVLAGIGAYKIFTGK